MRTVQDRLGDRRARATFRIPERRTGFDRRRPDDPMLFLYDNPGVLIALLVGLNLLSAADWMLTGQALAHGASEANLVIGALITTSPLIAGAFKAAAMLGVSLLIWYSRRYRSVLVTALGAIGLYTALMVYHAVGLASIGVL